MSKQSSVSILTITQLSRFQCLEILLELIKKQTYNNIIEWVIVEGSRIEEDALNNSFNIKNMISSNNTKFKINYIEYIKDKKLGYLRNIGSKACKGDITVCMDDDDYYPKTRVEHAVSSLKKSKLLIAGCDNLLIYDFSIDKIYQYDGIKNIFHSGNASMAWKKDYLTNHSYKDSDEMGEEEYFTNKFTEPMIALNPFLTIIALSHNSNTIGKKKLFALSFIGDNPHYWNEIAFSINKFIDNTTFIKYKKAIYIENSYDYDIIYYCGYGYTLDFVPDSSKNAGSTLAVIKLAENWAKLGKKVAVFAETIRQTVKSVDYYNWNNFSHLQKHKLVILWKDQGIIGYKMFGIKADKIWLDLHNNFIHQNVSIKLMKIIKDNYNNFEKIFVKSEYQKKYVSNHLENSSKIFVIPDGILINEFNENKYDVQRNPFRFCYTSCYNRGMITIIDKLWTNIYKKEPRAELHLFHGFENVSNEDNKFYFRIMAGTPGVMDHGRQDLDLVVSEKYKSSFYLCVNKSNDFKYNAIVESYITGCIPILSNHGIHNDLDGYHINFEDNMNYEDIADKILEFVYDKEKQEELRNQLKKSNLIQSWDDTFKLWNEHIK